MKDRDGSESRSGSHFEGDFDESRRMVERGAAGHERHHADQPLGGYGFGDNPIGSLNELEGGAEKVGGEQDPEPRRKHGRGFEPHSSREHWGKPATGQERDPRHLGRRAPPKDSGHKHGRGPTHRGRD